MKYAAAMGPSDIYNSYINKGRDTGLTLNNLNSDGLSMNTKYCVDLTFHLTLR